MFGEVESAFSISISNEEAENAHTVEDLLNLVLQKKGSIGFDIGKVSNAIRRDLFAGYA